MLATVAACASWAESVQLPCGISYVWWDFGIPEAPEFSIEFTIHNDLETSPGIYLQFYQGRIGRTGFYFGFQTNLYKPGEGGAGKGILYSRWGSRDLGDVRAVSGGWTQSAGYEGDFVGVRKPYPWTDRRYRCRLTQVDQDEKGMWYGLFVTDLGSGVEDYVGAIRFPRQEKRLPQIQNGGGTWIEVYSDAQTTVDVPFWHVSIERCSMDFGKTRPAAISSDYSAYPDSDTWYDPETGAVHLTIGNGAVRKHPKGIIFRKASAASEEAEEDEPKNGMPSTE